MYYPCSENKGADQLRGYREADLRLCFRIGRLLVFSHEVAHFLLFSLKTSFCTKNREYVKCVYLFASSNPSPCINHIDVTICNRNRGEVFDSLVGMIYGRSKLVYYVTKNLIS